MSCMAQSMNSVEKCFKEAFIVLARGTVGIKRKAQVVEYIPLLDEPLN